MVNLLEFEAGQLFGATESNEPYPNRGAVSHEDACRLRPLGGFLGSEKHEYPSENQFEL